MKKGVKICEKSVRVSTKVSKFFFVLCQTQA